MKFDDHYLLLSDFIIDFLYWYILPGTSLPISRIRCTIWEENHFKVYNLQGTTWLKCTIWEGNNSKVYSWQYALMNVGPWWKANSKAFVLFICTSLGTCCKYYGVLLLIYSSKMAQITPKIQSVLSCTTMDPYLKCHCNIFITFC